MNGVERTAADVMNTYPRTCSRFSRVIEAVLIFKDEDCGMVPVIEAGRPIGDRDVALALARWSTDLAEQPVEAIMSTSPVAVSVDTPLAEVVEAFRRELVRRLLVVNEEGALVGVIAWKDLSTQVPTREIGQVVSDVVESPTPR